LCAFDKKDASHLLVIETNTIFREITSFCLKYHYAVGNEKTKT